MLLLKFRASNVLTYAAEAALHEIDVVLKCMEAGVDLVCEGDKPGGAFVVLKGYACRYKLSAKGVRQIVALLLPGDICDLDVFLLSRMDHNIGTLS